MPLNIEERLIMISICMKKSEQALKSAMAISELDDYDGAADRAYYSMFHAGNALLLTRGIEGDSHKHVHNSISQEFVKSGELPDDTNRKIKRLERIRYTGDYSKIECVAKEEMEEALYQATEFLENAKEIINKFQQEHSKFQKPI